MGPLLTMFAAKRKANDDEFANFLRTHPNWGADDYSRALFQTRLSRHPGGMMPGDDGGPINLGVPQQMDLEDPNSAVDSAIIPRRGLPPMPFRDPMQAGPEPPMAPPLATMYGQR